MITSVSFRAATASDFQSKIAQPPKYSKTEAPAASANIKGENKKGGSLLKTGAKIAGGAAILAALLALGHKYNIFAFKEDGNKIINNLKGYFDDAGKFIYEKTSALLEKVTKKAVE